MGSKGSASPTFSQPSPMTTTQAINQQTNQQQTYTPNKLISQYAPQALQMGAAAATTPFSLAPQQIAPFTPMQQQYFSQLQAMQGMTNPYFQQAQGLMGQGAQDVQSGLSAAQQGLATSGQGLGYAQQGFNTSGQGLGYAQQGFNAAGSQIPGVNMAQQTMGTGQNILAGGIPGVSGAGQAVTSNQISQYLNPYAQAALADMQKYIFDPQRVQTMGSATQTAGGVGADRLALVSQNLDKTQADALAQAEAGFYQPAMAMAEQQKQMQLASGLGMGQLGTGYGGLAMGQGQLGLGAAGIGLGQGQLGLGMGQLGISQGQLGLGMGQLGLGQGQLGLGMSGVGLGEFGAGTQYGALGTAAQNAALQATGALGQAGTQQQGLNQAQLNALYQNQLMAQAYPFQSAQFLAGMTGGLAPALGGTTTGAGTTMGTGYGTQMPSQPSYGAQLLGLGTAGLGALGSLGTFGNKGSTPGMGLNPATNYGLSPTDYANMPTNWTQQQRGGRIGYQEGGSVDDTPEVNILRTDAKIPTIPLPMGSGQYTGPRLNLNPDAKFPLPWSVQQQQQTGGGSSGGSGILGAITGALGVAKAALPFFALSQGGAVNPFSAGQGFQEGGPPDDSMYAEGLPGVATGDLPVNYASQPPLEAGYPEEPMATRATVPDVLAPMQAPPTAPMGATPLPRARPTTAALVDPSAHISDVYRATHETLSNAYGPQAASAITANLGVESNLDPTLSHDAGTGIGMAGWRNERKTALYNFAQSQGLNPLDRRTQLAFLQYEIANRPSYSDMMTRMQNAGSPEEAARIFRMEYERPAGTTQGRPLGMGRAAQLASNFQSGDFSGVGGGGESIPAAATPVMHQVAGSPMGAVSITPLAREQMPYPGAAQQDWGTRAARSPWMSLIAAGAKMASSTQPLGSAIASGIGAGAAELESQRAQLRAEEDINQKADRLHQEAQMHLDRFNLMTPYEQARLDQERYQWQPGMGRDPNTGATVPGAYRLPTRSGEAPQFIPGAQITGKGGARDTALLRNINGLVEMGIAPDKQTAFQIIHRSLSDQATFQRLVQNEQKFLADRPENAGKKAEEIRSQAETNIRQAQRDAQLQSTVPAATTGAAAPAGTTPTPTAADIAYVKAHPEAHDRFKQRFGIEPP